MLKFVVLLLGLVGLIGDPAQSETWYVAPPGTALPSASDGSEKLPFLSLGAAFSSGKVKGGDTLLLKDGAYGGVTIKTNAAFDAPVEIASLNGKGAHFDSILLSGNTRNLILRNLSVWPRSPSAGAAYYLIRSYDTTSDISLDGLDIRGEESAAEYMKWDAAKWSLSKISGVLLQGPRSTVTNSKLTGIYHGIMVMSGSRLIRNVVAGYNGDGMRTASDSLVQSNYVYDCVKTDDNHDDGYQAMGGVSNLVLDSNVIIEWTGDPESPIRCPLQGIGLFGGNYKDITITNNVVAVSAYHGISIYGVVGARIANNSVIHAKGQTLTHPYIFVSPSKDGVPSTDVMVANNAAMSLRGAASLTDRVYFVNNSVIGTPSQVFENPLAFDYRPKASSSLIDTGDAESAPLKDVLGNRRPSGPLPDRGAYEIQVASTSNPPTEEKPVDEAEPAPVVVDTPTEPQDSGVSGATPVKPPKSVKPPRKSLSNTTKKSTAAIVHTAGGLARQVMTRTLKRILKLPNVFRASY